MDTLVRRRAEADFPLCRTRGFQKDELLGRIALHKMTSFLLMMTADSCARRRDSPCNEKVKPQITPKVAAPKVSKGRSRTSSVSIALWSPPQRRNPLLAEKTSYGRKSCSVVAPIWRDNVQAAGRAAWGRSCGSAKLVAGTLRCLRLCWELPWSWSPVKQLGRCPKPHKGAPPLDPARGNPPP